MDVFLSIVGGSCGAAIVAGIFGLIQWKLNRKAGKEDKREDDMMKINRKLDVLFLADRTLLYDRIKYLAKSYIDRGYVTIEEMEDLNRMHAVYHDSDKLNGNGFLKELMNTVNTALEIRAK